MTMFPKPSAGKVTLTPAQRKVKREKLFREQKGRCCYCECRMTLEPFLMNSCTLEHIVPEPAGCAKNDADSNLKAACFACNANKGSKRVFTS